VTIEKKSLIANLKTTKKAIIASTPTDARVSGKVLPRVRGRVESRIKSPVAGMRARVTMI
jgi:hypothetical protein